MDDEDNPIIRFFAFCWSILLSPIAGLVSAILSISSEIWLRNRIQRDRNEALAEVRKTQSKLDALYDIRLENLQKKIRTMHLLEQAYARRRLQLDKSNIIARKELHDALDHLFTATHPVPERSDRTTLHDEPKV